MRTKTTIAAMSALLLLLVACGSDDVDLAVDSAEDVEGTEQDGTDDEVADDPAEDPDADVDVDDPDDAGTDDAGTDDAGTDDADAAAPDAVEDPAADSPTPDAALVADPCGAHEGREMEGFIDLVAPVDDQVASGSVEIVGCSNVFEANIVWNLLDGDGVLLDEGFTTAECGNGCVGAFAEDVPLDAAEGEPVVYLQVFSPNASDEGPAQLELVERIVVLG